MDFHVLNPTSRCVIHTHTFIGFRLTNKRTTKPDCGLIFTKPIFKKDQELHIYYTSKTKIDRKNDLKYASHVLANQDYLYKLSMF